jgi:hypothetical protein
VEARSPAKPGIVASRQDTLKVFRRSRPCRVDSGTKSALWESSTVCDTRRISLSAVGTGNIDDKA